MKHVPGGELLMGGGHKGSCVTRYRLNTHVRLRAMVLNDFVDMLSEG